MRLFFCLFLFVGLVGWLVGWFISFTFFISLFIYLVIFLSFFLSIRSLASKLDYFVTVNGVTIDPKLYSGPTEADLQRSYVPVCACVATPVYHVDVEGSLTWSEAKALGDELLSAGRMILLFITLM